MANTAAALRRAMISVLPQQLFRGLCFSEWSSSLAVMLSCETRRFQGRLLSPPWAFCGVGDAGSPRLGPAKPPRSPTGRGRGLPAPVQVSVSTTTHHEGKPCRAAHGHHHCPTGHALDLRTPRCDLPAGAQESWPDAGPTRSAEPEVNRSAGTTFLSLLFCPLSRSVTKTWAVLAVVTPARPRRPEGFKPAEAGPLAAASPHRVQAVPPPAKLMSFLSKA